MISNNAINLGPVSITFYALSIVLGAVIALFFVRREWIEKEYDLSDLYDFFFNVLLIGIIGARIWYVIFNYQLYASNPMEMFAIWNGGLAIHGGLIAGIIYGMYYFKKRDYDFLDVADTALPYVLIAQAIGRWGNFFNQEAYGGVVEYSFLKSLMIPDFIVNNMFIDGFYHQPTFLYESIYCIVLLIVIRLIIKYKPLKIGQVGLLYIGGYSFGRFFIEQMRTDSLLFFGLKTAQIVSIVAIIFSIIMFIKFEKTNKQNTLQVRRSK